MEENHSKAFSLSKGKKSIINMLWDKKIMVKSDNKMYMSLIEIISVHYCDEIAMKISIQKSKAWKMKFDYLKSFSKWKILIHITKCLIIMYMT